jgi:hypothetical protein
MSSRATVALAVAGLIAAGAYGGVTLVRSATEGGTDPSPRVAAHDTAAGRADDVLLDAIENRFAPPVRRTPGPKALREYRTWIADRFGPAHAPTPLP